MAAVVLVALIQAVAAVVVAVIAHRQGKKSRAHSTSLRFETRVQLMEMEKRLDAKISAVREDFRELDGFVRAALSAVERTSRERMKEFSTSLQAVKNIFREYTKTQLKLEQQIREVHVFCERIKKSG